MTKDQLAAMRQANKRLQRLLDVAELEAQPWENAVDDSVAELIEAFLGDEAPDWAPV
jgi:hypothetical protein